MPNLHVNGNPDAVPAILAFLQAIADLQQTSEHGCEFTTIQDKGHSLRLRIEAYHSKKDALVRSGGFVELELPVDKNAPFPSKIPRTPLMSVGGTDGGFKDVHTLPLLKSFLHKEILQGKLAHLNWDLGCFRGEFWTLSLSFYQEKLYVVLSSRT